MDKATKQKSTPTVGVIMPAYNQGQYIDEALDSLRKQTFQDFVVHIVDDGSTDGYTPDKLQTIVYEKAKVFPHKNNIGVARRQKEQYKLLNTPYILILCADDKLHERFLESTVEFLDTHRSHGAVGTYIQHFGSDNRIAKLTNEGITLPKMLAQNGFLGSSLMRKSALDSIDLGGGFVRYQDWDRWLGMLSNGWKLGVIEEPLFLYRKHTESLSANATIEHEMDIRVRLYKKYNSLYEKYAKELYFFQAEEALKAVAVSKAKDWLDDQYKILKRENEILQKQVNHSNTSLYIKVRQFAGNVKRGARKLFR